MEMKLIDGDYVPDMWGGFERVVGERELLQRVLFKLQCRRGGFAPVPELGSRLYLLGREKKGDMSAAARQYIIEALSDEDGIEITGVTVEQTGSGGIYVSAELTCSSGITATVVVKQE